MQLIVPIVPDSIDSHCEVMRNWSIELVFIILVSRFQLNFII